MTAAELDELERLWREGVVAKQIAHRMGYSVSGILDAARHHRDRCPARHVHTQPDVRDVWVARHLAGRCTQKQAAEALGVSLSTVKHWVHLTREGAADGR